jgi:hypothetical protein
MGCNLEPPPPLQHDGNAQRGSDHDDGRGRPPVRDDGCEDGNAHAGKDRMPLGARLRLHVFTLTPLGHQGLTPWIRFGNRQSLHAGGDGGRSRERRVRRRRGRSGADRRRGVIRARNLSAVSTRRSPMRSRAGQLPPGLALALRRSGRSPRPSRSPHTTADSVIEYPFADSGGGAGCASIALRRRSIRHSGV